MGNDGGSIPRRSEIVSSQTAYKREDDVTKGEYRDSSIREMWQHCFLSHEPLELPIVSCALGRLYNKRVIIEELLKLKTNPQSKTCLPSHICNLTDIVDLQWESGSDIPLCPITKKHALDRTSCFVYVVPCGHVFDRSALTCDTKSSSSAKLNNQSTIDVCPICNEKFQERNIIQLNCSVGSEAYQSLQNRRKALGLENMAHNLKYLKKRQIQKSNIQEDKPSIKKKC